MSFPSYPKYKDSGVEWLGEVPEHWEVMPLKYVARFTSGGTPNKAVAEYWDGDVPWASSKDLKSETLSDTCDHITQAALDEGAAVLVPAGSVLVVVRGMILLHTFPVVQILVPMAINQDVKAVAPVDGVTAAYLPWLFRGSTTETFSRVDEAAHGTKVLRMESWTSIALPIPPHPEQSAIATFLDRETTKIDALIAEQQRLIELLQEKRQAVISNAVTKGLNPDASMKDSGIEWLGEVPEHWGVVPLKRLAAIQTGVAKGKDNSGKATISVPYLRVANVQDGYLDLSEVTTIDIPSEELKRYSLRAGDVLMNEGGDCDKLGRGCIWQGQLDPCITQNHVFAVRPRHVSSEWLNAITASRYAQFYFMSRSKQSTNLASISSTNLMELPVIVPPNDEQSEILAFMARQAALFVSLTAEATQAISLLQERRSALISAAVTGQIDVRGLAGSEAA